MPFNEDGSRKSYGTSGFKMRGSPMQRNFGIKPSPAKDFGLISGPIIAGIVSAAQAVGTAGAAVGSAVGGVVKGGLVALGGGVKGAAGAAVTKAGGSIAAAKTAALGVGKATLGKTAATSAIGTVAKAATKPKPKKEPTSIIGGGQTQIMNTDEEV